MIYTLSKKEFTSLGLLLIFTWSGRPSLNDINAGTLRIRREVATSEFLSKSTSTRIALDKRVNR